MFSQVRNTQRKANLAEINKALYQYYIDNGTYPSSVTTTLTEICDTEATSTGHSLSCTNKADLSALVPTYLVSIPTDPQSSGTSTGYLVAKNTANKVYLKSDNTELSQTTTIGDSSGVFPDRLVSYWSFDDAGAGTALDLIGGNNGTVTGATATTGVKGLANTAYAFDGTSKYINMVNNAGSLNVQNYTLSVWVKQIDASATGRILCKSPHSSTNVDFMLLTEGYEIRLSSYVSGVSWYNLVTTTNEISTNNTWYHIVGTYDSTNMKIYKNGGLVISSPKNLNTPIGGTLDIGAYCWGNRSGSFNGSIDNVRIYNKALSAEEVLSIYNTEKP